MPLSPAVFDDVMGGRGGDRAESGLCLEQLLRMSFMTDEVMGQKQTPDFFCFPEGHC